MRGVAGVAFGLRGRMRRSISAGLIAAAIGAGALAPTLAMAQGTDFNPVMVNKLVDDAHSAQFSHGCERFDDAIRHLDAIAAGGPHLMGRPLYSRQEADLARRRAAELRAEGCPKGVARTVRSAFEFETGAPVGVGATDAPPTAPRPDFNPIMINKLVGDAHFAQFSKQCEKFDNALYHLDAIAAGGPILIGRPLYSQQEAYLARRRAAELRAEGCPKGVARTVRSAFELVTVEVAGGATRATVPKINGGTQFDPGSGTEVPIASSDKTLTGGSANVSVTVPTQNVLWGDYFYLGAVGSWFDGNANGSVPEGGNNVAYTYIFPNPASNSTGIAAGATGEAVRIASDGRVIDISFGLRNEGLGLPFLGGPAQVPQGSDRQINFFQTLGFRYRSFNMSHTIDQQSLTFSGLNSRIELDQNSNFFGLQFGAGLTTAPPGIEPGFVGGIDAFFAPGYLSTSGTATQNSNCVPCGGGSPELNVHLRRDFSSSHFAAIVGGSATVGYRFSPNATVSLFGTVEHMTDVPFFNVPTTPAQQPINLGRGSMTNVTVGGRLVVRSGLVTLER